MLYTIVNPSDPYTVEAESLDVAAMACILMGQGKFAFKSLEGGEEVPVFFLGGSDKWCQKNFQESTMELCDRVMDIKMSEVADCLDSILYGDEDERKEFLKEVEGMSREDFVAARAARQDRLCSSLRRYSLTFLPHGQIYAREDC
jgi:hypothetical protein